MASALALFWPSLAGAVSLIRDAEIERTLRAYTNPFLQEAGIPPESVRLFIVNDPRINAFVAGGLNMFIHTGLIMASDTPDMLMGVIAHETGHMEGAHLSKLSSVNDTMQIGTILSTVLGVAVTAAGGGRAGAAVGAAGQNALLRNMLGDIRVNEQSADQAALRYFAALGYSAEGIRDMFAMLRQNERNSRNADPYLQTHPLTRERVANVDSYLQRNGGGKTAEQFNEDHARMRAKLYAFMNSAADVRMRYPKSDDSLAAQLARTIADYRAPNLPAALEGVEKLIAQRPEDPFFYDLKGQILFEHGRIKDAIIAYNEAVKRYPDSDLLWSDLGRAQLAMDDSESRKTAIKSLERSVALDNSNNLTWHHLGIAYGKEGRLPESFIALAEEASLSNDPITMHRHATRARDLLEEGTPLYSRADALVKAAVEMEKAQRENS